MVKINLQDEKTLSLNRIIAAAVNAIRSRSFSGRNPELGKMINCQVCGNRHRSSIVCEPKYSKTVPNTRKGINGAAVFAKKRFHPHPNKRGLQLIQMTQHLFPQHEPYFSDPMLAMKYARTEAGRTLKKQRKQERKFKKQQQNIARKINMGLAIPGSRP